ncbi:2-dehydropantoate 2-reductase [soil metagenome]
MGAGAVGCFYGGMLARAGHEVVLIGRAAHVDAIERDGLRLEMATFDGYVPMKASIEAAAVDGAELVLFCVKSTDTESAGAQMRDSLAHDAVVLSLQNGVDNADRLRTVIDQEVAAAVVYVAAGMEGPGHVRHNGRGELVIEPSSRSADAASQFTAGGVPTTISDNVRGELWAKLIINCAYNALSAITRQPYGELVRNAGVTAVMDDVVAECRQVATADGVTISVDVEQAVRDIAVSMKNQISSTARDLIRGKPGEIDHLNGFVMRRGQALGIATPLNRALWALVKALERSSG